MMLRIGLILLIIPGVLMMGAYLYEQSLVEACTEQGLNFDFHASACSAAIQEFVPFMVRHPLLVNGGMLLSVVGLFACLAGLYTRAR